jgi:hypothetical protein
MFTFGPKRDHGEKSMSKEFSVKKAARSKQIGRLICLVFLGYLSRLDSVDKKNSSSFDPTISQTQPTNVLGIRPHH